MTHYQSVFWRARAFQGSIFGPDSLAPEVTQLSSQTLFELDSNGESSFNERVVSRVRYAIEGQREPTGIAPFSSAARLKPFMTVLIETGNKTGCEGSDVWDPAARLDLISDGRTVHAGIWIEGEAERLLPTVEIRDGDTVWTAFVRLLALPGDEPPRG
jgi:hypothetical protein